MTDGSDEGSAVTSVGLRQMASKSSSDCSFYSTSAVRLVEDTKTDSLTIGVLDIIGTLNIQPL